MLEEPGCKRRCFTSLQVHDRVRDNFQKLCKRRRLKFDCTPIQSASRKGTRIQASLLETGQKPQTSLPQFLPPSLSERQKSNSLLTDTAIQGALNANSSQELKDLLNCLVLAECAYKVVDMGKKKATETINRIRQTFPEGAMTAKHVQWSLPSVFHRYMLAEDDDTIYVAFMGTKQRRDLVANAAVLQVPLWPKEKGNSNATPFVHRGFLSRAKTVPIEGLYGAACRKGKRLVLTGHSLGGSVAQLCVLRLLNQLPAASKPAVGCVTFACPAIGNPALSALVHRHGWTDHFQNLLIPEDVVPRLLASPKQTPEQVASATIAALDSVDSEQLDEDQVETILNIFEDLYKVQQYVQRPPETSGGVPPPIQQLRKRLDQALSRRGPNGQGGESDGTNSRKLFSKQALEAISKGVNTQGKAGDQGQNSIKTAREAAELFKEMERKRDELDDSDLEAETEDEDFLSEDDGEREDAEGSLVLDDDEEVELAHLEGADSIAETTAGAGSAISGNPGGGRGHQKLAPNQDIFFPWSSRPIPSFARRVAGQVAGQALKTAGNLKRLGLPAARTGQGGGSGEKEQTQNDADLLEGLGRDGVATAQMEMGDTSTLSSSILGSLEETDDSNPSDPQSLLPDLQSRQKLWRLGRGEAIGKIGANVGRAASGAARGAARFVSTPLRVAQRNYAVVGKQAFLTSAGVLQADEDEADRSFQEGLEGAKKSSQLSAIASMGTQNATPCTIVSLQLPIAAARRRQPFLMHKMAFHRARVLSVIECAASAPLKRGDQSETAESVKLADNIAPPLRPSRAEVFLPYSLPDNADLKVMIEDLGSLSALPPVTAAVEQSSQSRRFQWLKPWRWISGLGWKGENERAIIELTAQVQGLGLENCTSVQVQEVETGAWCKTEIAFRPVTSSPQQMYGQLGLHRRGLERRVALAAERFQQAVKQTAAVLDRTNAMGTADCLLVKIYLPVEVMLKMEKRLLQQSGESSGLMLHLTSDFHKAQVPLQVHGGGSWLFSDIRNSSRLLNDWLSHLNN